MAFAVAAAYLKQHVLQYGRPHFDMQPFAEFFAYAVQRSARRAPALLV